MTYKWLYLLICKDGKLSSRQCNKSDNHLAVRCLFDKSRLSPIAQQDKPLSVFALIPKLQFGNPCLASSSLT